MPTTHLQLSNLTEARIKTVFSNVSTTIAEYRSVFKTCLTLLSLCTPNLTRRATVLQWLDLQSRFRGSCTTAAMSVPTSIWWHIWGWKQYWIHMFMGLFGTFALNRPKGPPNLVKDSAMPGKCRCWLSCLGLKGEVLYFSPAHQQLWFSVR